MNTLLRRLPVKPLIPSFRSFVSKPFCSVVDNASTFVSKDEIFRKGEKLIVRSLKEVESFYSVKVDSACDFTAVKLDNQVFSGTRYVNVCKGLVCLWKPDDEGEDDIFLWNPTTTEVKKLPRTDNMLIPCRLFGSSVIGFGYDQVSDDYKVMRTSDSQLAGIMVSVYNLKNNLWTRADTIPISISLYGSFGLFANGCLHWLSGSNESIIAFDLGVHKHRKLPFPAGIRKKNGKALFVFNRCLGLIDHRPDSLTEMWVMNNNGVEASWSKLLSVEQPGILGSFDFVYPVAFSKDQNEILLVVDNNKLVWYDRETNNVKNIELHGFPESFDLLVCNESLVQISDSELDTKQTEEEKIKQKENTFKEYLATIGYS
ncbi:F-box domain-containing protein [Heracleum sosnowskyi]|uniref:F-box domain-containing protein n=1 Tax=Heracleum sosnowskyi TaxID=360622 RepID=A0AAD8MMF7_9APIA|nr:F-box domain-containing protein [Heracleum sosnowskyi]